ncbi:hypothetical protein ACVK00_002311 [Burkholderia sp. PvR073]
MDRSRSWRAGERIAISVAVQKVSAAALDRDTIDV